MLEQTEARLSAEDDRAAHYLSSLTAPSLRQILYDELLTPHLLTVLNMPASGLDVMIDHEKTVDLARLYRLFGLVPTGPKTLKRALKTSIAARGKLINEAGLAEEAAMPVKVEATEASAEGDSGKGKQKAKAPVAAGAGAQTLKLALKWVEDVLSLKDKFDAVLRRSFDGDRDLESGINEVSSSYVCMTPSTD
jgi:cullin 3